MSQFFERPKLKSIVHYYLNQYCEMEQLMVKDNLDQIIPIEMPAAFKKNMKVFIIEIIPTILVSDGHNFIEAVFSKESINEFRKYFSHVKFSNLRDKVIQLGKWSLQIDHVNSRKTFNSHSNVNIKLIIEQFKPMMHEQLTSRLTHKAKSIFKNDEIKALIQNFRHWHSMTSIKKDAFSVQSIQSDNVGCVSQIQSEGQSFNNDLIFPDLKDVLGLNKPGQSVVEGKKSITQRAIRAKKHFQNDHHQNSQNTTQLSEKSDSNIISSDDVFNFGGNIQNSQVFRIGINEYENLGNVKIDSQDDIQNFVSQCQKLKKLQVKDVRIADLERVVIQEMGEQYYAEKKYQKSRLWQESVEDEFRREELKQKIDYFNVGVDDDNNKNDCHYETLWQREEREKHQKRLSTGNGYNTRRIVGYTFDRESSNMIKEKLIKILDSSKTSAQIEEEKNLILDKANSPQKILGRPRANSQENILQMEKEDNSTSQLNGGQSMLINNMSREPLSQFITVNNVFNDDTQSEQDSMDADMNAQNNQERIKKRQKKEDEEIDDILQSMQPLGISMYRSYLQWFDKKDILSSNYVEKPRYQEINTILQEEIAEKAEKVKKQNFKMVIAGRTRSSRIANSTPKFEYNDNQTESEQNQSDQEEEDKQMEDVSQMNQIEPTNQIVEVQQSHFSVNNLQKSFNQIKDEYEDEDELMQYDDNKTDEMPLQVQKEIDSEVEVEVEAEERQENILSEISNHQESVDQYAQQICPPSLEKDDNPDQLDLSSPQFDTEDKQNQLQISKSPSVKSKDSEQIDNLEQEPIIEEDIKYESPIKQTPFPEMKSTYTDSGCKTLLEPAPAASPPKPIVEMTAGEKAMWDLQVEFQKMQEQMLQQQKMMQMVFEKKQQETQKLIKEEEDKKEREKQEKIRLEKEKKERLERERLEKLEAERLEKERQERLEMEKQEKLRLMRKKQKEEQDHMIYEDNLMKQFVKEENERIEQERVQREAEIQRQLIIEQERLQKEAEIQRQQNIEDERLRKEEEKLKLQQEFELKENLRKEAEHQESERIKLEQDKIEDEKQNQVQHDKFKRELQAVEAEKKRRMARLIEEQKQKQRQIDQLRKMEKQRAQLEDDDDLDWTNDENKAAATQVQQANNDQDITLEEESSDQDDKVLELESQRLDYVNRMCSQHEGGLNKKIRDLETKDMTRRKIKDEENQDKLWDFLKIKNIKQEKIEQQRKQLLQETSSSQKDSKENSLKGDQNNQEENRTQVKNENEISGNSSSKISESDGANDQDANLNQFDLFEQQKKQDAQFDELLTQNYDQGDHTVENDHQEVIEVEEQSFDDVEEIIQSSAPTSHLNNETSKVSQIQKTSPETPPQSKQMSSYSDANPMGQIGQMIDQGKKIIGNNNDNKTIQALQEQLANLTQVFQQVTSQIQHLSSQQQVKQSQQVQESVQNEQVELEDFEQNEKESEEDFHLPAFGSQVQQQQESKKVKTNRSPKKKAEVQPFSLPQGLQGVGQKRNFNQYEESQKYQLADDATEQQVKEHYIAEYKNSPSKQDKWSNLTDFVMHQTMQRQKDQINLEFKRKEHAKNLHRQYMRQNGGQSQRSVSADRSQQRSAPVQQQRRDRDQSRERIDQSQRAPQQFQGRHPQGQNIQTQPQMRQMQAQSQVPGGQRPANQNGFQNNQMVRNGYKIQQQQQQRPVRYSARGPGPQQGQSPPKNQGQMPTNQNVGGNKRYVHTQVQQACQNVKENEDPANQIQQRAFNTKMQRIKEQQEHELMTQNQSVNSKRRRYVNDEIN